MKQAAHKPLWSWISSGLVVVLVLTVFLAAIVVPVSLYRSEFGGALSNDAQQWGIFGDYLGGLGGTILSAGAFLGLMLTFVLQGKQLSELKEVERIRRLEDAISGLLDALESIIGSLDLRNKNNEVVASGRDVIRNIYEKKLKGKYAAKRRAMKLKGFPVDERVFVRQVFDETFREHGADFGHYFRTLYRIVVTIDESAKGDDEARKFLAWMTCRLSRHELLLLFYNCLGTVGEKRFGPLCERYALLEHVERIHLIREGHVLFYQESAFGTKGAEVINLAADKRRRR